MDKPWFEVRPKVLERELNSLTEIGFNYEIDEVLREKGVLRIKAIADAKSAKLQLPPDHDSITFIIVYPENYPFFRPAVYAVELDLPRHQNPIDKNLCLISRPTIAWDSGQSAAGLIQEQISKLFEKAVVTDPDVVRNDPTEQAEPVSEYYATAEHAILFDPSLYPKEELDKEDCRFLAEIRLGIEKTETFPHRMAVIETASVWENKTTKVGINYIRKNFDTLFYGRVFRIPGPPPTNPKLLDSWLRDKVTEGGGKFKPKRIKAEITKDVTLTSVTGLCFPEEIEKGVWGYGWLFHVESIKKLRDNNKKIVSQQQITQYLRGSDIAPLSKNLRAPKLAPLTNKKVSIAGLGALGSFIAIELARSGVKYLNLIDHDAVEPATTIRWPLGLSAVGINKAAYLAEFIRSQYPGTIVNEAPWLFGSSRALSSGASTTEIRESQIIDKFLENSHLLIDATAEFGVHHLLSYESKRRDIPYISLYATPGAYGGSIMRQIPYKTGCWSCFIHMESDGSIPALNVDETNGWVQPPGCGSITFTGANVDLQQISLMAVKLAISTLCKGEVDAYPPVPWHIARVNLFGEKGELLVPDWKTYDLPVHPHCHYCN